MFNRRNSLVACSTLFALAAGFARPAHAQVYAQFVSGTSGASGNVMVDIDGHTQGQTAGEYSVKLTSGATSTTVNGYCVDITHSSTPSDNPQATMLDLASNFANASYNNSANGHTKQQNANAIAYLIGTYSSPTSQQQGIDVGLAIWDIANDGGDGISSGNFTVSSGGNASDVATLEAAAYSHTPTVAVTWVEVPKLNPGGFDSSYQDYGIITSASPLLTPNTAVPEPGVVTMLCSLGVPAGIGLIRHRRRRTNRG